MTTIDHAELTALPENLSPIDFHWGVKIPLRDDVRLSATVYTPAGQRTPLPCALTMTPYSADTYHDRGVYFAKHGVPFVIVDVRGRGNSEGIFRPNIQEAKDGYDVVQWLAQQPYCNGKVAMWGGSYAGHNQWATAKEFPPNLATIVPAAAPYLGVDYPMRNNIFYPQLLQWLTFVSGCTAQLQLFYDDSFWAGIYRKWHLSGRSFRELADLLGNPHPLFQEFLMHPESGTHWDEHNPTALQYARLELPILTITGSYDDDQPGALEHYQQHIRNASPKAAARHYLIIGPWDHAGTRTPKQEVGGMRFGPESLLDLPKLHLQWYAWTMQGAPTPEFLKQRVAYYVTSAERWRYANSLEEVTAHREAFYLDSVRPANDVLAPGILGTTPGKGQPDSYTYDPRDTSGPEVDAEAQTSPGSLVDQSVVLALRGRELVYESPPFTLDREVTGFFKLSAWIAIDTPDTDLYAAVYEIAQDDSSVRLSTDAIRARYREGLRTPRLIDTRHPLLYHFEHFTFTSRQLKRGRRLRLVITPIGRLMESTFVQKNYNSGGVVAAESAEDSRPVTVRLFHDNVHPSALYIPWGRAELADEPTAPPAAFFRR